jgi:hypothetical protein
LVGSVLGIFGREREELKRYGIVFMFHKIRGKILELGTKYIVQAGICRNADPGNAKLLYHLW